MPTISGRVIFDANRSAAIDPSEVGIINIPVVLRNTANGRRLTVLTNTFGDYSFINVPDASYTITEAYGVSGGIASPGDFSTAVTGAVVTGTDPPISFAPTAPATVTNLDSLTPNTLNVTVAGIDLTDQNFLDGPVIYTSINSLLDPCATIGTPNLITVANNGDWGTVVAGTPVNTAANPEPYPGVVPGFTYTPVPVADGFYTVINIFSSPFSFFWRASDHTVGDETGRFAIYGGANPNTLIFTQTITVTPNTNYIFTAWIANLIKALGFANPALGVRILDQNGNILFYESLGNTIPASLVAPEWKQLGTALNSGINTQLTVQFTSEGPSASGNDFMIDDIELKPLIIPEPTPIKSANKSIVAIGDVVTFTIILSNTCQNSLTNVNFKDLDPNGLVFNSGTVTVDGISFPAFNPNTGFSLPDISGGSTVNIQFKSTVTAIPNPNPSYNVATMDYKYTPITGGIPIDFSKNTNAVPILASVDSFECGPTAYQVVAVTQTSNSAFRKIDPVTGAITVINPDMGAIINSIGYNPTDDFIYGIYDTNDPLAGNLARIDSNGNVTNLGAIPNLPGINITNGCFDANGFFYIKSQAQDFFYTIDLRPGSPNYMQPVLPASGYNLATSPYSTQIVPGLGNTAGDWVCNPVDNLLYTTQISSKQFVTINPITGVSTILPTITNGVNTDSGGMFNDSTGYIYTISNSSGELGRWSNNSGTIIGELFSMTNTASRQDATLCPRATIVIDFGDAPDINAAQGTGNYSTRLANNGPRHAVTSTLRLGVDVTAEADAYQNTNADGDDISKGVQDDALVTWPIFPNGSTNYSLDVSYVNATGSSANIYAWIDFNKDGIFQLAEAATINIVPTSTINPRISTLNFTVPTGTTFSNNDTTYARIRITTDTLTNINSGATQEDTRSLGGASNGEVEDYLVMVRGVDFGDAPDTGSGNAQNNYSTLLANNGPRHLVYNTLTLGTQITSELDAYQNGMATGDDISQGVQDDSLSLPATAIAVGSDSYELTVTYVNNTGKTAYLYGWVDFNQNGIFELEEAATVETLAAVSSAPKQVVLKFKVPSATTLVNGDTTFIRLRLTTDSLQNTNVATTQEDTRSLGFANDGEVEDFLVTVIDYMVTGTVWYDTNCNGIRETGEVPVAGSIVNLYDSSDKNTVLAATTTDASGNYKFDNLKPGSYCVKVILPNGFSSFTLANVGINEAIDSDVNKNTGISEIFTLSQSDPTKVIDAGLCKCFTIAGLTFYDCVSNGVYNPNDNELCGVLVSLIDSSGNSVMTTRTDCDGKYEFNCIYPGAYIVKFEKLSGMNYTVQEMSLYGSKVNSLTGEAAVVVSSIDIVNIYAGYKGNFKLQNKYCGQSGGCSL